MIWEVEVFEDFLRGVNNPDGAGRGEFGDRAKPPGGADGQHAGGPGGLHIHVAVAQQQALRRRDP